jgi:CxxC motif-containing protein (DUF1111 family)
MLSSNPIANWMRARRLSLFFAGGLLVESAALFAATPQSKEAPSGFHKASNGFVSGDEYDQAVKSFETVETPADGLGPVYNETSCVACHQNPVTGAASQTAVIRAGYHIPNPTPTEDNPNQFIFVEPKGGSLIHQRAIDATVQEQVPTPDFPDAPKGATVVHGLRMATNILGDGFIEVLPDEAILEVLAKQPVGLKGLPVPVLANLRPKTNSDGSVVQLTAERLGRFGWKCQEASLLNFSAGAYLNEMGITTPLNPEEDLSNGRDVSSFSLKGQPNDGPKENLPFGEDVTKFATFMRSTTVPPRDFSAVNPPTADVIKGEQLFRSEKLACAICHQSTYTTPPAGSLIHVLNSTLPASDLAESKVPEALGNKIIHPYSDFMLHDIGTGDGIVQTQHAARPPVGKDNVTQIPNADELKKQYRLNIPDRGLHKSRATLIAAEATEKQSATEGLDQRMANMIRTAPLWGLRVRPQLLHDGRAFSIEEAILAHVARAKVKDAAAGVDVDAALPDNYKALTADEKRQLLAFLRSL